MASNDDRQPENGGPNASDRKSASTGSDNLAGRMNALDEALGSKRTARDAEEQATSSSSDFGKALRMSSEFIAGVIVGGGLGYFIDHLAGTSPWGLIIFLLLGFGAGILNVMRSAGVIAQPDRRVDK